MHAWFETAQARLLTMSRPECGTHEYITSLPDIPLPSGIRSRFVEGINGLRLHVLEAGYETPRPAVRAAAAWLSRTRL